MGSKSTRSTWVLTVTCLGLAVPILIDLLRAPRSRPFGYVAADTFYYLSVARNMVERGSPSMDGVHAINGFHPIWQLVAAMTYAGCKALGHPHATVLAIVLVSLVFAVAGVWLLGRAIERAVGYLPIPFAALPFGVYALCVLHYHRLAEADHYTMEGSALGTYPVLGTLFSFVNGMESSLVIFAFGLVAWTTVLFGQARTAKAGIACGGALAFLCLARIDHAAFAVFPALLWAIVALQGSDRRGFALSALLTLALPIAAYAVVNKLYAGAILPLSGVQKSSFPVPEASALSEALEVLKRPFARHSIARVFRTTPTVFPMIASVLYLSFVLRPRTDSNAIVVELRPSSSRFEAFLASMSPGVLLLGTYNLLFVYESHIGHWYQPISTLYMSLTALSAYIVLRTRWQSRRPVRASSHRAADLIGVAATLALVVFGFVRGHYRKDYHSGYAHFFWHVSGQVRQALAGNVPPLLEADDGIVGYSLETPAMSSSRLCLDREAMSASKAGHLVDVAVGRGYAALATFFYGSHSLTSTSSEGDAHAWAESMMRENLSSFRASVLYGDPSFTIVLLRRQEE
jgi:hypothetical protein